MPTSPSSSELLTVGEAARRSGVAASALRFYEARGLIRSIRTSGNQRRFPRSELRRVAVIQVAQSLGLSLREIAAALDTLPDKRTPTKSDWVRLSKLWRASLDARIDTLERLRDQLTGCIGCGCLSLRSCGLFNVDDEAAARGGGPRYLLGDRPRRLRPAGVAARESPDDLP